MGRLVRSSFALLGAATVVVSISLGVSGSQQVPSAPLTLTDTRPVAQAQPLPGARPLAPPQPRPQPEGERQRPALSPSDIHEVETPGLTIPGGFGSRTRPAVIAQPAVISARPAGAPKLIPGGTLRGSQDKAEVEEAEDFVEREEAVSEPQPSPEPEPELSVEPELPVEPEHASEHRTERVHVEDQPEAVRVTEIKVVEERKKAPEPAGAALLSAEKAAEISREESLKQQEKTRQELEKHRHRSGEINVLQSENQDDLLLDAERRWKDAVEKEAKDASSWKEAEASVALKEMIRTRAEQEREALRAGGFSGQTTVTPESGLRSTAVDDEKADACRGLEVTTTRMSSASLGLLYYFNPDSVIQFHSVSLLLPDGKTFLANVRAVVRDPPPTEENKSPKSVVHLSGGYKLTLSLEEVKLEDGEDNEIATWDAESVLYPVILEEVSIRDAAAVAPAQSGPAGVVSNISTSTVPGGPTDAHLLQTGDRVGIPSQGEGLLAGHLHQSQAPAIGQQAGAVGGAAGPSAVVAGGRAMKTVRVLAVSRGNVGSVRVTTNRNVAPGMGAFTCVFRTGIYGDYDPCNTPAVIAANFFTPLTASIIGGF
ncbi:hypothetical protein BESB_082400 [Besnoitia besnoiti]|uniref:Uncharacterized protein n=1 Tax=Besnoitia besnoiti TaxID=94643 RepID=A0A2A9M9P7_BESBE|nr:hypothetical protein BESB_082400 [Besnoitia besnoiti]PFH33041.1 hypothetical protein BESB_082400 [Besnoitia besnoiti]